MTAIGAEMRIQVGFLKMPRISATIAEIFKRNEGVVPLQCQTTETLSLSNGQDTGLRNREWKFESSGAYKINSGGGSGGG